MSFKRLYCDLALKQEVIVYAKRHGIRAAGCNLVLLKQVSVIGAMTVIPFFFFFLFFLEKPSALQDTGPKKGKESYPNVEAVLCFVTEVHAKWIACHMPNNAIEGRKKLPNFSKTDEIFQNKKEANVINLLISQDCNYGIMSIV